MILIADGGSTKADWIAIDNNKQERFRVRTLGLNPAVISSEELTAGFKPKVLTLKRSSLLLSIAIQ